MASFALVRFKCNGRVEAVPVQYLLAKRKKNGLRTFEPYKPTSVTDFLVSKRHKYAVIATDGDGNVRRWYAMIGRLGVSKDEVLKKAESHVWPGPTRKKSVKRFVSSYHACGKITEGLEREDAGDSIVPNVMPYLEPPSKPALIESCERTGNESGFSGTQGVQPLDSLKLHELLNKVMNSISEVGDKIVRRLDEVEQSLSRPHVREWLNNIPDTLPGIIGASDFKVDQQVQTKKLDIAVGDTAEVEVEENYVDAKSEVNESSAKVAQNTEEDLSESEVTSNGSDFPEKDMFYSFLEGVIE
ncbi:Plasma membrane fusion protein PRM1 [Frankliniella fusca]|uniref:Plasma membrane fusion protein PRM1 n=1 Tax=Frankliniella fusca TaxID=407009 RepID=A0AAE1LDZ7_9NEOP|nr:Plasma membrane fusion protein PRM1 [Frankliniella fusca]